MDGNSIERIRNASFSHAVRGYDRHEVDEYLAELAGWLERGGDDAAGSELVRSELERVGEQTAAILTEAHDVAETIRDDAAAEVRQQLVDANATAERVRGSSDDYSEQTREDADAYARTTRTDADDYAEQLRGEVDAEAAEARASSQREAERIVEEANRRRRSIESVISDLEQRRDAVLGELDRLASGIAGAATQGRGSDATPAAGGDDIPTEEVEPEPVDEAEAETTEQAASRRSD